MSDHSEENDRIELGRRIRRAREAKGWSQRELSRRCDVPQSTISNIEAGRTASPVHVATVCTWVNLSDEPAEEEADETPAAPLGMVIKVRVPEQVYGALVKFGKTGLFSGPTAEEVAAELLREVTRTMLQGQARHWGG